MDAEHEVHVCSKTKVLLVTFAQVSAYVPPPAARRWHPQRDSWAAYARREYSSVSRDRCPKSSPRVRRQVHQANKLALATPAAFVRCWNFFLIFSLSRQNPAQTLTCINMRRVSSSSESTLSTTRNSSQVTLQEKAPSSSRSQVHTDRKTQKETPAYHASPPHRLRRLRRPGTRPRGRPSLRPQDRSLPGRLLLPPRLTFVHRPRSLPRHLRPAQQVPFLRRQDRHSAPLRPGNTLHRRPARARRLRYGL